MIENRIFNAFGQFFLNCFWFTITYNNIKQKKVFNLMNTLLMKDLYNYTLKFYMPLGGHTILELMLSLKIAPNSA